LFGDNEEDLEEEIRIVDQDHRLMLESIRKSMFFVNEDLTHLVPFNYPNLVFVAGRTGDGKTTFAAAMILGLLTNDRLVLVISNEELAVNYYTGYIFTVSSASATAGDVYKDSNNNNFTVVGTISGQTTLWCSSASTPAGTSGTLTKTGSASITY